jgi:tetratricopeptide (TPR) repeat protein
VRPVDALQYGVDVARRRGGWTWRALSVGGPTGVAAVAAWALVADDKVGWTVVSGSLAAMVGAFAPSVTQWWAARRERHHQSVLPVTDALVAELPEPVAWLLHPRRAVVGFFGRGWVLRRLEMWSSDPHALVVRLVIGGGGVGKTRLAWHFAERLTGWAHWPVAPQGEPHVVAALRAAEVPERVLLTVDYAETRDPRELAQLLCAAQQASGVRVLLLARRAGLWWETLSAAYPPQAHLVDALTAPGNVIELPAQVEERRPEQIVSGAVAEFAAYLRQVPPPDVPAGPYEPDTPVLRLHAEALLAVLGGPQHDGRYDVLAEVLSHEARYWRGCARRAGLAASPDPASTDALLRQLVGIGALLGAADERQTAGIVRRAPLLADARAGSASAYVAWLRGLYPTAGTGGPLGTLQPDLLAEALAVGTLRECTPAERTAIFSGLTAAQAVQALLVLGRASAHRSDAAEMIDAALAADVPRMTEAVLQVGLQFPGRFAARTASLLMATHLDPGWARAVVDRVPSPSLELSQVALALTTKIVAQFGAATPAGERATWLNRHAITLGRSGRGDEALAASVEAVALYRQLAVGDRSAYLADLATSLRNVALGFAGAGRRDEALASSVEAVGLYRELAARDGEAYLADLATSVNNLAVDLAEAGRRDEALASSVEAVGLYRELAARDGEAYLADLATSVNNLAADLAEAGRRDDASRAAVEAVQLYRRLAAANRDAYLPHLADSVSNCAVVLARVGRQTDALAVSTEAVELRRELAAANGDAYLPALATSLNNHANRLAEAGRQSEALAAGTEAVGLYRELAADGRRAYLAGLATALWNVGAVSLAIGHVTDRAITMTAEGVRYLGALATTEPDAFAGRRDAAGRTLAELRRWSRDTSRAGAEVPPYRLD